MKKWISAKLAGNILLLSLALFVIFHVLVLVGVAPADIIWGGQIQNSPADLLTLEIIALFVTLLFAVIIAAKIGYIRVNRFRTALTIGVWIIFAYLVLNTVGNLASAVTVENLIFAPITMVLAFCALRVAIET
jgi:hypothetical protein